MEVGAGPRLHGLGRVGGIAESSFLFSRGCVKHRERLTVIADAANESRFSERDELVAFIGSRPIQLLRLERQGIFRPTIVTRHALATALELPQAHLLSIPHFLLPTVSGH